MASPQPDKFTRISNELLEALIRHGLSGSEWRLVLFIIRMTYGYQRKVIKLRTSDLISGACIAKQNINRTLNGLLSSNILLSNQDEDKHGATYGLQKDYDKWRQKKKKTKKVIKLRTKSNQNEDKQQILPSSIKERKKVTNKGQKKSTEKEATDYCKLLAKKNNNSLIPLKDLKSKFPWLKIQIWADYREHRKSLKKYPYSPLADTKAINQLKKLIDKGYRQDDLINASIINCWRGIFEPFNKPDTEATEDF